MSGLPPQPPKRRKVEDGSAMPTNGTSSSAQRLNPNPPTGNNLAPPALAPQAPPPPPDARLSNPHGRVNFLAEQRRQQGVAPPNPFLQQAENTITRLPQTTRFQTSFGPTTVSNGRGNQPKISSRRSDFGDVVPPGSGNFDSYREWSNAISPGNAPHHPFAQGRGNTPHFALQMVQELEGRPHAPVLPNDNRTPQPSHLQNRAMAAMVTTVSVAEEQRLDGSTEMAQSVLRRVVNGQTTFHRGFDGHAPEFAMAGANGGTGRTRALAFGQGTPTHTERYGLSEWSPPGRPRRWSV